MAFDEFIGLMGSSGLINDEFTEREAILAFAEAMMTQVDELDNDRHMKMQLVEYFEALGRAAEETSLAPPDSNVTATFLRTSPRIGPPIIATSNSWPIS
jgi:hypothetical protein